MSVQHVVNQSVASADIVLIKDNLMITSRVLSYHFVSSWIQSSSIPQVTALLLEQSPANFEKPFSSLVGAPKIKALDVCSDARGWNLTDKKGVLELPSLQTRLTSLIPSKSTSTLFIDSLAPLAYNGATESQIAAFIADLKLHFSSIVCVLHTDVLTSSTLVSALESVATCVVEMVPTPKAPLLDVTGSFSLLQKRKSGKVSRVTEHYHLPKNSFELAFYTDCMVKREAAPSPAENRLKAKMDQLTPEQEAARAAVALPYAKARVSASTSVSGLPEHTLDTADHGTVYVDPEDIDPDADEFEDY
jgi:hypothetical protein